MGPDHAMAGDDDRDRVAGIRRTDRPRPSRLSDAGRDLAVAGCRSVRDLPKSGPDGSIERGALEPKRKVEAGAGAREVLVELAVLCGEAQIVALPSVRDLGVAGEFEARESILVAHEEEGAYRGLVSAESHGERTVIGCVA